MATGNPVHSKTTLPLCILFLFILCAKCEAKKPLKILVYSPTLGFSHTQFMGSIANALAQAGHQVHFLRLTIQHGRAQVPAEHGQLAKSIQLHELTLANGGGEQQKFTERGKFMEQIFSGKGFSKMPMFRNVWFLFDDLAAAMCQTLLNRPSLTARLQAVQFDVAIAEVTDLCPFAFFRRIGARTWLASITTPLVQNIARKFAIPTFSSFVPNLVSPMENAASPTFLERTINFYNDLFDYYFISENGINLEQPIVERAFGSHFPSLKSLSKNISLLFVNSNPFFEIARPISNKIIYIGGIVGEQNGEPMSQSFQTLLDGSLKGSVLVSFGTVADTRAMGHQMKLILLKAFSRFPDYTFLWKLDLNSEEEGQYAKLAPNVKIFRWLDQKAILGHPKLRAFISHCGHNSVNEAARAGVPILAIPLFVDQPYNAQLAKQRGMAVPIDIGRLTGQGTDGAQQLVEDGLRQILDDPAYRRSARLLARKLTMTPFSGRERLIQWVEFAAEFPPLGELNLPGEDELGPLAYYSLDMVLLSLAAIGTLLWLTLSLAKCLLELIFTKCCDRRGEKNKRQ